MRIEYLYRYPVKGLTAEALEWTEVEPGRAIPWDRAFALTNGENSFDPANPAWAPARSFMCHKNNARIALLRSTFDPRSGTLAIRAPDGTAVSANALYPEGQAEIAAFLTGFLADEARGTPRFVHAPGHTFGDKREQLISLISLDSLRDYEARVGARRHRRRFRANIWFDGAGPWTELEWVGRTIQVGGATLRVVQRTSRCAATEVNPESAARDVNPVEELRTLYGHTDLGIYGEVVEGGRFAVGDSIEVLPD